MNKKFLWKIVILLNAAILLSCNALPYDDFSSQSWMMPNGAVKRSWTTLTLIGVHVDRGGGWNSIETEAALLAPLYFWNRRCKVVLAEEGPEYAAQIWIRERNINLDWNSKKSLSVDVRIWPYEDAPDDSAPVLDQKLPAAVGRIVMLGKGSFSSTNKVEEMLSKAIKQAVRKLFAYKRRKNA